MENIGRLLSAVIAVFRYEVTIYGFTFSYWEVLAFGVVASIVAKIIGEMFMGD